MRIAHLLGSTRPALLLSLLALAACAPATVPPTQSLALLEVANRTELSQEIFLDGQRIGVVPSGQRRRFESLAARDYRLHAAPAAGGARITRPWQAQREPFLVWSLGEEHPEPPGLGSVQITNDTPWDMRLQLDGVEIGTLFGGEWRELRGVQEGRRELVAVVAGAERRVRKSLDVLAGVVSPWTVRLPTGSLRVHNAWDEPVEITRDGRPLGRVAPRSEHLFEEILDGTAALEATGAVSGATVREELAIRPEAEIAWRLSRAGASLVVENRAGEPLAVAVDGRARGLVAPLDRLVLDGLRPGSRSVEAVGAESGLSLGRDFVLEGGGSAVWQVDPRFGVLRVTNASPERQLVYVDGQAREEVRPSADLLLSGLTVGAHTVAAVGLRSATRMERRIEVRPESTASWRVPGVSGHLVVRNEGREAVRLYLDAKLLDVVEAGETARFLSLPCGEQLVEARGLDSRQTTRGRVTLSPGRESLWLISEPSITEADAALAAAAAGAAAEGTILVYNRSGERLRLSLDGVPLGDFADGADIVLPGLSPGRHQLSVAGLVSAASLSRRLELRPSKPVAWTVGPQLARLRVWNRTGEALQIYVGGQPSGRVAPEGVARIGGLAAGTYLLEARGERSGLRHAAHQPLSAAHTPLWELRPARATLLVSGAEPEPLQVLVDGELIGQTGGRGDALQRTVPAGEHMLVVAPERGEARLSGPVRVEADRTLELALPAPRRELRVFNHTAWTLRVHTGDRFLGELPPGERLRDLVVPSARQLPLRAQSTEQQQTWRTTLWVESLDPAAGPAEWHIHALTGD